MGWSEFFLFMSMEMNILEKRILQDGIVRQGGVLKVDSFLNHLIDIDLMNWVGSEFKRRFNDIEVTKILTAESSGIAVACITANYLKVPVLFAKKSRTINMDDDNLSAASYSYTHQTKCNLMVSRRYILPTDKVLIIDDFLANGNSSLALADIVVQAGACVTGIGIVIEKGMQDGGKLLRKAGYRVESLAIIGNMDPETGIITFRGR